MHKDILDDQLDFHSGDFDNKTIAQINLLKIDANECVKHIQEGRKTLFGLCVLTILGIFISIGLGNEYATDSEIILEGLILLGIYGSCALLVSKNPRVTLLIAFIVYVLMILLTAIVDVESIFSGIIIKALIFFFVGRAIISAFKLQKIVAKLRRLGVSRQELSPLKKLGTLIRTKRKTRSS